MSAGQGSCPLPWHRASFLADLFPQSQPHRAALEVRQKTVPLFDLRQRLRRLQTGHLRLPCSNQHRPQGHSRFPPHPPFPDILKITDREEVKYNQRLSFGNAAMIVTPADATRVLPRNHMSRPCCWRSRRTSSARRRPISASPPSVNSSTRIAPSISNTGS